MQTKAVANPLSSVMVTQRPIDCGGLGSFSMYAIQVWLQILAKCLPLLSPYSKQHNDNLYGNFMWSPTADCDLDFRISVLILNSPASFF